jgi:hypothetical protein
VALSTSPTHPTQGACAAVCFDRLVAHLLFFSLRRACDRFVSVALSFVFVIFLVRNFPPCEPLCELNLSAGSKCLSVHLLIQVTRLTQTLILES